MHTRLDTLEGLHRLSATALLASALLFSQVAGAEGFPVSKATGSSAVRGNAPRAVIQNLPLVFELNQGQTDPRVKFLSRGNGYALFLTPAEAVLSLSKPEGRGTGVLRMTLAGANPQPHLAGKTELPGKANYLIGNDSSKWRANVPTYAKVEYAAVYPGVDLVYYGSGRTIEYDFIVAPGADPEVITLAIEGAEQLALDAAGDLVLQMDGGELRMRKPVVYQDVNGARTPIAGHYVLKSANQVGFQLAAYDASKVLVIDPVLVYSTFLGGSGTDEGRAIARDNNSPNNVYVTGTTQSSNFPLTSAFDSSLGGNTDAFVTKLNSSGSVVFSTYLGGGSPDAGLGIAVDGTGIYVAGLTQSSNFPTTKNAYSASNKGSTDAFITKLNLGGTQILYSTFLGGKSADQANAIAVAGGKIYVTGSTASGGSQNPFPTTTGAPYIGGKDTFVAVLNPDNPVGMHLVYSTLLGTIGDDSGNGIATDGKNSYVTGSKGGNAFVAKFSATGALLSDSPLGVGVGNGIAVDAVDGLGNAYVTGSSGLNAFVVKLTSGNLLQGPSILLSATGKGIAVSGSDVYVTGSASSDMSPPVDTPNAGLSDAFVAKFAASDLARQYFTYLGGSGNDVGNGIAIGSSGIVYVTGTTQSTNFPLKNAYDSTFGGTSEAFVAALQIDTTPPDVTINQAATQPDPTKLSPINFTIVFSEPVTGFDATDVTIGGTAGGTKTVVLTPSPSTSVTTYNATVSGMTTAGSVIASIEAGKVTDLAGNPNNAFTSADNSVFWANVPPVVTLTNPLAGSTTKATPLFGGTGGTIPGDLDPITVKIYSGASASGVPVQTLTTNRGAGGAYSVASAPLTDGLYTAQAQQSDVLGNTGSSDAVTFTADATPPVFGPVSNLMFQTGTPFSFPQPVAIDAKDGPRTVTCTVPGSPPLVVFGDTDTPTKTYEYRAGVSTEFPLGDTTVTCTATDVAENPSSIEFTVTVTTDAPPALLVNAENLSVKRGAPIPLTAVINVFQSTLTIAPDCVNTTWTIKRSDGSVVEPKVPEKMYGIPNDLATLQYGVPTVVSCDIIKEAAIDPALLPPGSYRYFATYSNYIRDFDCKPGNCTPPAAYDVWTGSVKSEEATLTVTDDSVMRVGVDIKPTTTVNSWNCDAQGTNPVAIVSGEIYDPNAPAPAYTRLFYPVTEVDISSVRFGKTGTEVGDSNPGTADVNGDGVPDLVFHFPIVGSGFSCEDIPASRQDTNVTGIVTGLTKGTTSPEAPGAPFAGSDGIRLVTGANNK